MIEEGEAGRLGECEILLLKLKVRDAITRVLVLVKRFVTNNGSGVGAVLPLDAGCMIPILLFQWQREHSCVCWPTCNLTSNHCGCNTDLCSVLK